MNTSKIDKFNDFIKAQLYDMVSNSPVIYKYINFETGKLAIQDSTLGFTHPLSFNDPYDCSLNFIDFENVPTWYRKNLVSQYFPQHSVDEKQMLLEKMEKTADGPLIEMLKTKGMENEIRNRGVSCFSRNFNNMLMWSHYANSHKGICIGFNLLPLYLSTTEIASEKMMVLVDYETDFKSLNYYEYKQEAIVRWLKTKAKIWEYEEEIRIIINNLNFEGSNKFITEIPIQCFNSVYFGTNVSIENKRELLEIIAKKMPEITVFQMITEKKGFELQALPHN